MKNTKTVEKINESLRKSNAAFKNATKAEKRVMIAKDVLAQIKAKRYIPESGTWVDANWNIRGGIDEIHETDSVQKLFADRTIETCSVCALGGLFMSCTNLNNNTCVSDINYGGEGTEIGERIEEGDTLSNGLNKIFSKKQLQLIEVYFEKGDGWFGEAGYTGNYIGEDSRHVEYFNDAYPDDDERLVEIMKNIVANDGTFVPSKLKIPLYKK
jgi:hypothetical protein